MVPIVIIILSIVTIVTIIVSTTAFWTSMRYHGFVGDDYSEVVHVVRRKPALRVT